MFSVFVAQIGLRTSFHCANQRCTRIDSLKDGELPVEAHSRNVACEDTRVGVAADQQGSRHALRTPRVWLSRNQRPFYREKQTEHSLKSQT